MMNNDIFPCIWFNQNGSEAAQFYTSVFKNSKIKTDTSMVVNIEIEGQKLMFLSVGPQFRPNQTFSLMVICNSYDEIDNYYNRLSENGKVMMEIDAYPWSERYAWVEDQYGISWQLYFSSEKIEQKFSPVMMFTGENAGKCREAIHFYTKIFPNANVDHITEYQDGQGEPKGNIAHAQFTINSYQMKAMDSSHDHKARFSEGTSMVVMTNNQEETDLYWNILTENGEESMCGWLKDQYGFSWQITPKRLIELTNTDNPEKNKKAFDAMLKMKKINIKDIEDAVNS